MTAPDVDEWDEWEDNEPVATPSTDAQDAKVHTHLTTTESSSINTGEWGFDLTELEHEISNLVPSACLTPLSVTDGSEEKLLSLLNGLPTALQTGGKQLRTLQTLALVARLHVEAARGSFAELHGGAQATAEQLEGFKEELHQLAGEWSDKKLLGLTLTTSERQQLEEISGLLHSALSAENEDLTLFQEVIEQLFAGMEEQRIVLSTNWLRGGTEEGQREKESYLDQILAIHSEEQTNSSRMPTLSEAEIFQDAKDIKRDELLINGVKVEGTRGYDAVVDALQHELEHVLARQVGKTPEQTPMAVSNALQSVAMAILHASNRTESGGCSYELLGKFLSNHEMDRVLLRPDSARAAPLQVHIDVGPYCEAVPGSKELTWAFGLRVKLLAVTWYLVCDAEDPTNELYEVETTFCNRLAFPVGLTPFHSLDNMRKDRGDVAVRLVLPTPVPTPASPRQE